MNEYDNTELKAEGVWWLPDATETKVGGILSFSQEIGGVLQLFGGLGGIRSLQPEFQSKIIYGATDKGEITLYGASIKNSSFRFPGTGKQVLHISSMFIGAYLSENDLSFNRIDIAMEYLPEFCSHSGLSGELKANKKGEWLGLTAKVAVQKPINLGTFDNGKASIRFSWKQRSENYRSLTLEETCFLTLKFDSSLPLDEILTKFVRPTQNLITLAADRSNAVTKIRLENQGILGHNSKPVDIQYIQGMFSKFSRKQGEALLRRDMLFTLRDLKRNQFRKWLELSENFNPAVSILFSQRYSKSIHLENHLLSAVSALEAFHRRKFKNTVLSKSQWKSKKKRILKNISMKVDKDFLNQVLQHSNEKRLKKRISEVLNYTGLKEAFISNEKEWNDNVRDYRNILTHYDPESPKEIENYDLLFWLIQSLSWVLIAAVMRELGFKKRVILNLLNSNERFKFAMRRMKKLYE